MQLATTQPLSQSRSCAIIAPQLTKWTSRKLKRLRRADLILHGGKGIGDFVSDEVPRCPDEGSPETLRRTQASHFADFWLML
jgi:hypothetical protein